MLDGTGNPNLQFQKLRDDELNLWKLKSVAIYKLINWSLGEGFDGKNLGFC